MPYASRTVIGRHSDGRAAPHLAAALRLLTPNTETP